MNILVKRSQVSGRRPTDLEPGELAVNVADGALYFRRNAEVFSVGGGLVEVDASAFGSWNLNRGSLFWVNLNGNLVVPEPEGGDSGRIYRLLLAQDATGDRLVTLPPSFRMPAGAPAIATTPRAVSCVEFIKVDSIYLCKPAIIWQL